MRYWDQTRQQRAALTEENVESFLAAELMEAGVLEPREPELVEIVEPLETIVATRWFAIKRDIYTTVCVLPDIEAAKRVLDEDLSFSDSDYSIGDDYRFSNKPDSLTIEPVDLYSQSDVSRLKPALTKLKADKEHNREESRRHNEECEAMRDAVDGIWSDWRECKSSHAKALATEATLVEYVELCDGDAAKAVTFLNKAIGVDEVRNAAEWLRAFDDHDGPLRVVSIDPTESD